MDVQIGFVLETLGERGFGTRPRRERRGGIQILIWEGGKRKVLQGDWKGKFRLMRALPPGLWQRRRILLLQSPYLTHRIACGDRVHLDHSFAQPKLGLPEPVRN